jgi:predicted nucleic acid-binding protein
MLLDTSGLLCFFDGTDVRHPEAVSLLSAARQRLTHDYVLAEFIPLCQSRGLDRTKAIRFIADLLINPIIEIVWVDAALYQAALALLQARLDKTYSLCDAVSFLLMRERGLSEALTTDHHFAQEGFVRLLAP